LRSLLERIGGDLSEERRAFVEELVEANELGLGLEVVCEALLERESAVDNGTREEVMSLAKDMGLSPDALGI
jgi:hypothetical protein